MTREEKKHYARRDFLRDLGGGALLAATGGLAAGCGGSAEPIADEGRMITPRPVGASPTPEGRRKATLDAVGAKFASLGRRDRRAAGALAAHQDSLEEYFRKHPVRSAKQARVVIERQTGIRRGLTQVRHFLKDHLGLRWRKTGAIPMPPKKTVEEHAREQATFLKEELEPRLKQARRGRRQVYFVDAAHFVFAPFLGFLWCAVRLFVRAASGRKRYNVLGALNAVTHRLIRVTNHDYINAESVCDLLRAVAEAGVGLPITLVLDNARYQKCAVVQALAESLKIELLYLPGYLPNLNLIERLWRFLRKESLDSTYYEDYTHFTTAIDRCLDDLPTVHKDEMETLLTHKFQTFGDVPLLAA
jgi:transposase